MLERIAYLDSYVTLFMIFLFHIGLYCLSSAGNPAEIYILSEYYVVYHPAPYGLIKAVN